LQGDDPIILPRGRIIPTTGWDSVWNGIAQWFGITDEEDLNEVVPNRGNMASLFTEDDMFKIFTPAPTDPPTVAVPSDSPTPAPTPGGNLVTKTVNFANLQADGVVSVNGISNNNALVTSIGTFDPDNVDGPDYVLTITITGQDFDNDGNDTDSLAWKVRVKGYRGVDYYMCSGYCASVSGGDPGYKILPYGAEFGIINRYIGRDDESIVFSVEDIQLTTSTPGFTVTFDGFTRIWATSGSYIFGKGISLLGVVHVNSGGSNAFINLPTPYDELQITVGENKQERIKQVTGSFTVSGYV